MHTVTYLQNILKIKLFSAPLLIWGISHPTTLTNCTPFPVPPPPLSKMSLKLSFIVDRSKHSGTLEEIKTSISNGITTKLNALSIQTSRFYPPTHNSIKVLFPNETHLNKALDKYEALKNAGYEPRVPIALKATRTIFCYGFDPALLTTYSSPNEIKGILVAQGWKPRDIIIMNSKKSFKIIMETSQEARNYINALGTSIGGIQLLKENKEHEIDPSISQCWACGRLNPNHNSNTCPNPKVCIKCNSSTHQIFDCPLPKSHADMSQDKKKREALHSLWLHRRSYFP